MIPIADFSPTPLRQGQRPICIACSYACSVGPLVKANDLTLLNEWIVFQNSIATSSGDVKGPLGLPSSASGYAEVEAMHTQCQQPGFVTARKAIEVRRIGGDLALLETLLKNFRATGIIALSFPAAANRGPHSISIACDPVHGFFIRDSDQKNLTWNNIAADATGASVLEALKNWDATAIPGEAILFKLMFDAKSKQQLEEMLGYERFVLADCVRRLEEAHGQVEALKLTINDDAKYEMHLSINSSFSGGVVVSAYEQLTGLLFSAAYKILDMIIEWTLQENGMPATVWQFSGKVTWLARPNITFPDFLGTDPQLVGVLKNCYQHFLPCRNAMIHGKWGEMKNGALHFDFTAKSGMQHTATFTSSQVMAWVEAVSQIASMLLAPATVTAKSINAVKRKLDLLQPHHAGAIFSIPEARPFRVVRRTEAASPITVDMQLIRSVVEKQALGKPYEIELRIESGKEGNRDCWEIPPENVPTNDFRLDPTFDRYKVNP